MVLPETPAPETSNGGAGLRAKVIKHLTVLYGPDGAAANVDRVVEAFGITDPNAPAGRPTFSADEVVLITYGDSLIDDQGTPPLQTLAEFVDHRLGDVISTVHVLPFFPASSDGGFAVVDYTKVDPALGSWDDMARVGGGAGDSAGANDATTRGLMADLILNHGSAQSEWFEQFRQDQEPGRDYYVTADPEADLSAVVRPRTHRLLQEIETPNGTRHVWCTFSFDQVDFDFANPELLIEFCRIIDQYVAQGVTRLRLDAVAYVWKQVGTSSIHMDQTHEIVRLMHTLLAVRAPEVMLITETNVPHAENVSYFGDSNEAHVVYNFSLVPLVLHTLLAADATALTSWATDTPPIPEGTAYLNFLASHDGMGVRPAEGLLSEPQIQNLVEAARTAGGTFSPYATPNGERPYELNVSLADILGRRDLSLLNRYVCAHAIMLAFAGIPAIYVHSLLATPGDIAAVRTTGIKRNINRSRLNTSEIGDMLDDPEEPRTVAFDRLSNLARVRRGQPAFAPDAEQEPLAIGASLFGLRRSDSARSQVIYAISNVTAEIVYADLVATMTERGDNQAGEWTDLITGEPIDVSIPIQLTRWQSLWLTRR